MVFRKTLTKRISLQSKWVSKAQVLRADADPIQNGHTHHTFSNLTQGQCGYGVYALPTHCPPTTMPSMGSGQRAGSPRTCARSEQDDAG